MVAVGAIAISRLFLSPCAWMSRFRSCQGRAADGVDAPGVELQLSVGSTRVGKCIVRPLLTGNLHGCPQGVEVNRFCNFCREGARGFAVEGQPAFEKHILQTHHAQADRPPAHVGCACAGNRVEVQVDDAIELAYRDLHGVRELLEIEAIRVHVSGQVDGTQVADGSLAATRDLQYLRAQIGQMHRFCPASQF